MATRKAVARAAIDSIKPLHVRSTSVLGGRPAWGVGGGAAPHGGGSANGAHHLRGGNSNRRMLAPQPSRMSGGRVRDNLVGPSRASLVQGGRHRPSPLSLVQGGGSAQPNNNSSNSNSNSSRPAAAPSLVQGRTTQSSRPPSRRKNLVNGTASSSSAAKLNGVPIQYQQPPQHQTYQQSRAELVRGRRSTLGGVVTLANGQRVNGARPAYLLRREAQQQHHQQQHQQQSHSRYKASSSNNSSLGANPGGGAVVTDLSADETDSSSSSSDDGSNPGKYESDLVVVLDMDECLIHSQFLSQQAKAFSAPELDSSSSSDNDGDGTVEQEDKYRQPDLRPTKSSAFHTDGEEAESIIASNCEYFRIHLPDGDLVHVNKRPNLDSFLADVTARFETHIFTAALDVYANPLLDRLEVDLGTKFAGRFYREHCVLDPDLGVYVKDLGLILDKDQDSAADWSSAYEAEEMKEYDDFASSDLSSSFNEGRVVLVDNNPLSFLANPSNGILVSNFVSKVTLNISCGLFGMHSCWNPFPWFSAID